MMESSRSKRRRLMLSYVSPRRPDLPAIFESLNDDTLTTVLGFVGDKSYAVYAMINKHCKEVYIESGMKKETFLYGYAPLSAIIDRCDGMTLTSYSARVALSKGVLFFNRKDVLDWVLGQRTFLSRETWFLAAEEGRIDILDEVWNYIMNDEGDKRYAFGYVDEYAARGGKLNVLKWYETKGLSIDKRRCACTAASCGHLNIIQWLQEEKGLELKRELYYHSIDGGQLHLIKWLREQEVDWGRFNFMNAAHKGNFNILKWLHDEGCPWPRDTFFRVHERALKPEVIDWCRVNGYLDRIVFRND